MRVAVYQESSVWNRATRWFSLTAEELRNLHVRSYHLAEDEDGDVIDQANQIAWIEAQHPGCVLVY